MALAFDKRGIRRLPLKRPAAATFSASAISIINLSTVGAGIEHVMALTPGKRGRLEFFWGAHRLSLSCEIVRTKVKKGSPPDVPVYVTGLAFYDETETALTTLRKLIGDVLDKRSAEQPGATPSEF